MITFPRGGLAPSEFIPLFHLPGRRPVLRQPRRLTAVERINEAALEHARRLRTCLNDERQGGTTTQWVETMFVNGADYSAFNTSASEGSLLGGQNQQPSIPAFYFDGQKGARRTIMLQGQGILGTTSTPTLTFQVRMGTAVGSASLSGASVGVSKAITTQAGVSNQYFYFQLLLTNYTPGLGSGNDTISGAGYVYSPGGFASPFMYPLEPTTPDTATWTQTFDSSVTQYINVSATWSASSSSNTATLKNLLLLGMN